MTESAGWRVLWRNRLEPDPEGPFVDAASVGILGGPDPHVVVIQEYHSRHVSILKCDNTDLYRLSDGEHTDWWSMFKYPIRTPRIDVADLGGQPVVVVNAGHGVSVRRSGGTKVDDVGDLELPAEDVITGTFDGRLVAAAAWNSVEDNQPALVQAFDLTDGGPPTPVAPPWRLPVYGNNEAWEWDYPFQWRLGRVSNRPVAALTDEFMLDLRCAVTGDQDAALGRSFYLDEFGACDCPARIGQCPRLLTVDDRAGQDLALVARHNGDVGCYDVNAGRLQSPLLTGHEGELLGARLGRVKARPVAALLLDHGISLYDLDAGGQSKHIDLGARAFDLAFGPDGLLAIATDSGVLAGQLTP
jgi:hypothetical protein